MQELIYMNSRRGYANNYNQTNYNCALLLSTFLLTFTKCRGLVISAGTVPVAVTQCSQLNNLSGRTGEVASRRIIRVALESD